MRIGPGVVAVVGFAAGSGAATAAHRKDDSAVTCKGVRGAGPHYLTEFNMAYGTRTKNEQDRSVDRKTVEADHTNASGDENVKPYAGDGVKEIPD